MESSYNIVIKSLNDSIDNKNVDIVMVIDYDGFVELEKEHIVEPKFINLPIEFWFNNDTGFALPILHNYFLLPPDHMAGVQYSI